MTAAIFVAACASQVPDEESSSTTGGTRSSSTSVFSPSQPGTGASSSMDMSFQPSKLATDTADGTESITADEAAAVLEDPGAVCQGWAVEVEAEQSLVEFVVDVSGSMLLQTASTAGASKWERTRTAVKAAVERLPVSFGVGMVFYPDFEEISLFWEHGSNDFGRFTAPKVENA